MARKVIWAHWAIRICWKTFLYYLIVLHYTLYASVHVNQMYSVNARLACSNKTVKDQEDKLHTLYGRKVTVPQSAGCTLSRKPSQSKLPGRTYPPVRKRLNITSGSIVYSRYYSKTASSTTEMNPNIQQNYFKTERVTKDFETAFVLF